MILYLVTLIRAAIGLKDYVLFLIAARSSIGRTPDPDSGELGSIPRRATNGRPALLGHVAQLDRAVVSGTAGWGSSPHVATKYK